MKLTIILLTTICLFACNNSTTTPSKLPVVTMPVVKQLVFEHLAGTWQRRNGNSFERWSKNEDGTYRSSAFSIKGTDTTWNEQARVYRELDQWVFENTVAGQNNGKAVKFTTTLLNEKTVQFSNPFHDFPTDINYTITDAHTLVAYIVGPNSKGGKDTIPFHYTKVK